MAKTITINTVQGIGDIFWVYQKLAPYFDVININVLILSATAIQLRSKAFCRMLPKVGAVAFIQVTDAHYRRLVRGRFAIADLFGSPAQPVDYAVNAPLEQGVKLVDIDPGSEVQEFVDLGLLATVEREDHLCAFVSGTRNDRCWTVPQWIAALSAVARRMDTKRIVVVGADWDVSVHDALCVGLRKEWFDVSNLTGKLDLGASVNVIRGARFFVGFQSGLNVIADNYDVPQLMLYYKMLEPMLYTWCKRANVKTMFHAATFADDAGRTISDLPLRDSVGVVA